MTSGASSGGAVRRNPDGLSFGREKRLLLAGLALAAPIPLPFSEVIDGSVLFLYAGCIVFLVQRVERGAQGWLPDWALNLLGLVYFPLFGLDLWRSFRLGQVVTALLHLVMFLVLVKLFSIRREKDKWHLVIAIFFLFLGSMATSSHVSVAIFLLLFLTLTLFVLACFAYLHVLTGFHQRPASGPALPIRRPLVMGTTLVVLLAIPIFAAAPRLREPFIFGSGESGLSRVSGFSEVVDLSLTSSIRGNSAVALRLSLDNELLDPAEMRFKGATFERYDSRRWRRPRQWAKVITPNSQRRFVLAPGEPVTRIEIFREPMRSTSLVLPLRTLELELHRMPMVALDDGGAAMLSVRPDRTLRYVAYLGREPVIVTLDDAVGLHGALDDGGITPEIRELARRVAGDGSDSQKIDRVESHLLGEYGYTTDFVGREGERPLEDFLFVYRSGHCELFASAMVLMLRSMGIPARLVTGFLGAEYNPIERYYMVRQYNAHAWVEAWSPERGWRTYDPTPPEGRPEVTPQTLMLYFSQVYDFLTYRWDRYVLTYGAEDQESFFERVRDALVRLWRRLSSSEDVEAPPPVTGPETGGLRVGGELGRRGPMSAGLPIGVLLALFAAAVGGLVWWNRRQPVTAGEAYRRLRDRLERAGLEIADSLAPLDLQGLAIGRFPATDRETRRLVALYLRESFAGESLSLEERFTVRDTLRSILAGMRTQVREERRPSRERRGE